MTRRNTITAILFLALTAAGLALLAASFFGGEGKLESLLKSTLRTRDAEAFLDGAESAVKSDLDRDHWFIQLYGGVQRLSGRRLIQDAVEGNTVAKLSTGALNFVNFGSPTVPGEDVAARAENTAELARALEAQGVPYLYVAAPQKLQRGVQLLPEGLTEGGNAYCDAYLENLALLGVDYLDLRPAFEGNGIYSSWFFRTDHHWKPEGAFLAWQYLTGILEEDYGIATDPAYTDAANYDQVVYEDYFLGSQGKRVGTLYAGTDDIVEYIPKFETDFTYECPSYPFTRTGPFEESLLFPERVAERDWFNGNPYTLYAGGDYPLATITNHRNPEGKKIVLLRESFSCAMTPFLALSCSELTTIDLRYFQGDLTETLEEIDPDLVVILYCVSSLSNQDLFDFD